MERTKHLLVVYGALRAARSALPALIQDDSYAERVEKLDEELRKLTRDIAQECGI